MIEYIAINPIGEQRGSISMAVPEGPYFVLGDNRDNSNDSRTPGTFGLIPFGSIPEGNIFAKVAPVYWNDIERKIIYKIVQ